MAADKGGAAVLSLQGVTKRFSGLVALDDVSFDVRAHETVG